MDVSPPRSIIHAAMIRIEGTARQRPHRAVGQENEEGLTIDRTAFHSIADGFRL
jgi:hypothetical protein